MSFDSFAIDPALLAGVRDLGFEQPTDIQQDAIPWALEGRDVLACAMTGSGKTAAFGLPILQRLLARERGTTRALILSPTRELALQIDEHLHLLGTHTPVGVATIFGGVAYESQERAFREGVDILVATPGRLLDHLRRPYARLDGVEVLVLDEADRMLDMGFIPDVRRILRQVPRERQTMLFSATLPSPIVRLSNEMLVDPVTINLERRAIPAEGVRQAVYPVRHELKPALLLHLLGKHAVESALVFTRTRERADLVGEYLRRAGIAVAVIHGDRSQQHRTRAMEGFKKGRHRVLVATDVAARGIDVEELSHVINLDVPNQPDDYIHRVGRTARAGATGDAWTFVAARELADLHLIEKSIGQKIERIRLQDFDYSRSAALASPPPVPAIDAATDDEEEAEIEVATAEPGDEPPAVEAAGTEPDAEGAAAEGEPESAEDEGLEPAVPAAAAAASAGDEEADDATATPAVTEAGPEGEGEEAPLHSGGLGGGLLRWFWQPTAESAAAGEGSPAAPEDDGEPPTEPVEATEATEEGADAPATAAARSRSRRPRRAAAATKEARATPGDDAEPAARPRRPAARRGRSAARRATGDGPWWERDADEIPEPATAAIEDELDEEPADEEAVDEPVAEPVARPAARAAAKAAPRRPRRPAPEDEEERASGAGGAAEAAAEGRGSGPRDERLARFARLRARREGDRLTRDVAALDDEETERLRAVARRGGRGPSRRSGAGRAPAAAQPARRESVRRDTEPAPRRESVRRDAEPAPRREDRPAERPPASRRRGGERPDGERAPDAARRGAPPAAQADAPPPGRSAALERFAALRARRGKGRGAEDD